MHARARRHRMSAVAAVTLAFGLIGAPAWSAADGGHGEHEHPAAPAPAPVGAVASTTPTPTPSPAAAEPTAGAPTAGAHDMEGMSAGEMSEPGHTDEGAADPEPATGSGAHSEHDEGSEPATGHDEHAPDDAPAPERARGLVLGSFAGVNAAVLLGAGLLRRHDRAHPRHPARAATGTRTATATGTATGTGTGAERPARTSPRPEADR